LLIFPKDGAFPVKLEGGDKTTMRAVERLEREYSEGKPLAKTVSSLCDQWVAMHGRPMEGNATTSIMDPRADEETAQTYEEDGECFSP